MKSRLRLLALAAALCSFALISTTVYAGDQSTPSSKPQMMSFRAVPPTVLLTQPQADQTVKDLNLLEGQIAAAGPNTKVDALQLKIKQKLSSLVPKSPPTTAQPAVKKDSMVYGIKFTPSKGNTGKWETIKITNSKKV